MAILKKTLKIKEIPSYDIIGDIATFSKMPKEAKKQKLIANKLLKLNKKIKTVKYKKNIFKLIMKLNKS